MARRKAETEVAGKCLGCMAHEVHESLIPYLVGAVMHLEGALHELHPQRDAPVQDRLRESIRLLHDAIDQARRLTRQYCRGATEGVKGLPAVEHLDIEMTEDGGIGKPA